MDWYDIDDILYDGDKEQIAKLKCPDCNGRISYSYSGKSRAFSVTCNKCGYISGAHGSPKPN